MFTLKTTVYYYFNKIRFEEVAIILDTDPPDNSLDTFCSYMAKYAELLGINKTNILGSKSRDDGIPLNKFRMLYRWFCNRFKKEFFGDYELNVPHYYIPKPINFEEVIYPRLKQSHYLHKFLSNVLPADPEELKLFEFGKGTLKYLREFAVIRARDVFITDFSIYMEEIVFNSVF